MVTKHTNYLRLIRAIYKIKNQPSRAGFLFLVVSSGATTEAASASAKSASIATAARGSVGHRPCFVHDEFSAVELLSVPFFNGLGSIVVILHLYESETT